MSSTNEYEERPTIVFGVRPGTHVGSNLKPFFYGIEEEQIPSAVKDIDVADVVERAYQSALNSRLSVGVANDGNRIVVHYRNLKADQPLFDEQVTSRQQMRDLGANAARLVKGIPFKGYSKKETVPIKGDKAGNQDE